MRLDINEHILKVHMFEYKDFIYKDKSYAIKDYGVVVDGELCCVISSKRNEEDEVILILRRQNNTLFYIEGTQKDINNRISGVAPNLVKTQEPLQYEHPDAMSVGSGIAWYIVAMIVSSLFKGNWVLWIIITIIFINWYNKKPKFKK